MDGVRLNDSPALDSLGVDKRNIVEEITRAYAHQIFIDGFFNADPHPGKSFHLLSLLSISLFLFSIQKKSYITSYVINSLPVCIFIGCHQVISL